ncbi:hypothetical protein [Falsiroseomonas sp. E2-1-a20]
MPNHSPLRSASSGLPHPRGQTRRGRADSPAERAPTRIGFLLIPDFAMIA